MKKNIILIVDDIAINRDILRMAFEEKYEIMEAENGLEALEIIKHYKESFISGSFRYHHVQNGWI